MLKIEIKVTCAHQMQSEFSHRIMAFDYSLDILRVTHANKIIA